MVILVLFDILRRNPWRVGVVSILLTTFLFYRPTENGKRDLQGVDQVTFEVSNHVGETFVVRIDRSLDEYEVVSKSSTDPPVRFHVRGTDLVVPINGFKARYLEAPFGEVFPEELSQLGEDLITLLSPKNRYCEFASTEQKRAVRFLFGIVGESDTASGSQRVGVCTSATSAEGIGPRGVRVELLSNSVDFEIVGDAVLIGDIAQGEARISFAAALWRNIGDRWTNAKSD